MPSRPDFARTTLMNALPPAMDSRWLVSLPTMSEIQSSWSSSQTSTTGNSTMPILNTSTSPIIVETINFPFSKITTKSRYGSGSNSSYPDMVETDNLTISFYEDENYTVTKYLLLWKLIVVDANGLYGLPVFFKKTIRIFLYNSISTDDNPVLEGTFVNTWPAEISAFELNYTNDGKLTVSASFPVDTINTGTNLTLSDGSGPAPLATSTPISATGDNYSGSNINQTDRASGV